MSIESNTFAEACYDTNSIDELEHALRGDADETDMKNWKITATEWRQQITQALTAKRADNYRMPTNHGNVARGIYDD